LVAPRLVAPGASGIGGNGLLASGDRCRPPGRNC